MRERERGWAVKAKPCWCYTVELLGWPNCVSLLHSLYLLTVIFNGSDNIICSENTWWLDKMMQIERISIQFGRTEFIIVQIDLTLIKVIRN